MGIVVLLVSIIGGIGASRIHRTVTLHEVERIQQDIRLIESATAQIAVR